MSAYKGLFAAASLTFLSACASTGGTTRVELTGECLQRTTTPDGQRVAEFNRACGENQILVANTTVRTAQEEARRTIETAQRVEAMRLLAIRARVEIGSAEQEDLFSRQLLEALQNQDPEIRRLATDAMTSESVSRESLTGKVAHWNRLRQIQQTICVPTTDGALACGPAVQR